MGRAVYLTLCGVPRTGRSYHHWRENFSSGGLGLLQRPSKMSQTVEPCVVMLKSVETIVGSSATAMVPARVLGIGGRSSNPSSALSPCHRSTAGERRFRESDTYAASGRSPSDKQNDTTSAFGALRPPTAKLINWFLPALLPPQLLTLGFPSSFAMPISAQTCSGVGGVIWGDSSGGGSSPMIGSWNANPCF